MPLLKQSCNTPVLLLDQLVQGQLGAIAYVATVAADISVAAIASPRRTFLALGFIPIILPFPLERVRSCQYIPDCIFLG